MEKNIKQLEKEYLEFIPENKKIKEKEEMTCYIEVGIGDIEESIEDLKKQRLLNKKDEIEAKIRNFLFFLFEQEEVEYYEEDNELIDECIKFSKRYLKIYEEIREIIEEENYQELYKLVEFSTLHYNENVEFLNDQRKNLEYQYQGIYYCSNHEDTREELIEFLQEKIKKYQKKKVVKQKTM